MSTPKQYFAVRPVGSGAGVQPRVEQSIMFQHLLVANKLGIK